MKNKNIAWMLISLLSIGGAGTGFYKWYQKNQELGEQKARFNQVVEDLTAYRNKNRSLEEQVQQMQNDSEPQQTITELTKKLQTAEENLKQAVVQQDTLKQLQATVESLTQQLQSKDSELQTLTAQKNAELQKYQEQQALLEKTLHDLTQENTKLTGQMQVLEQAGRDLKASEKIVELSQKVAELEANSRILQASSTDKDTLLAQKDARIQDLTQQLQTGQQDLEKRLGDLAAVIKDSKTTGNETWRTELEQQIQVLTKKLEEANQTLALQEKVSALTTNITELTNTLREKDAELLALKQQIAERASALADAQKSEHAEIAARDQKISLLETSQSELTTKIAELTNTLRQRDEALLAFKQQVAEQEAALAEVQTSNVQSDSNEKDILLAQKDARIQELTQQLQTGQKDLEKRLGDLVTAIKDSKTTGNETWRTELEQQIQALMKKLEEADQTIVLQENVSALTTKISEMTNTLREKDEMALALKQQVAEQASVITDAHKSRETEIAKRDQLIAQLETRLKDETATRDRKIASLESTVNDLEQKSAALLEKYQAALNAQQESQTTSTEEVTKLREANATLEKQRQEQGTQLVALQEQIKQLSAQATEAQTKIASLEQDIQKRDADYQQQTEQHNQMIQKLKEDIESGNVAQETIQKRLQDELDRSKQDYQKRLEQLALEKEKKEQELQQLQSLATTYEKLTKDLKNEIEQKTVTIEQYKEKLTVKIVDRIVFRSGQATINADGRKVLNTVADLLKQNLEGRQIRVEGHTDSVPIGGEIAEKYPTNWELSVARAVNVVRYLQNISKIPASKLSAVGYGEYRPVADNDTKEGRAQNRRIEIVLIPELERSDLE